MKCPHLIKLPLVQEKVQQIICQGKITKDVICCFAESREDCFKKKQPCEINRRCWEMKK